MDIIVGLDISNYYILIHTKPMIKKTTHQNALTYTYDTWIIFPPLDSVNTYLTCRVHNMFQPWIRSILRLKCVASNDILYSQRVGPCCLLKLRKCSCRDQIRPTGYRYLWAMGLLTLAHRMG